MFADELDRADRLGLAPTRRYGQLAGMRHGQLRNETERLPKDARVPHPVEPAPDDEVVEPWEEKGW
jgi:hypothetical protein